MVQIRDAILSKTTSFERIKQSSAKGIGFVVGQIHEVSWGKPIIETPLVRNTLGRLGIESPDQISAIDLQEEVFRTKLETFEDSLGLRVELIEVELATAPEDFKAKTNDERVRHIYEKTRPTIAFTDGLHWLRLITQEEQPGPHVERKSWLSGRLEDYNALLCKIGLTPEAAQLVHIGLIEYHRALFKSETLDGIGREQYVEQLETDQSDAQY